MPIVARTGEALIRMGLGPMVARLATFAYNLKPGARRRFSFDDRDNWVNQQDEVTFVSPTVHTLRYAEVRDTTRDIWEYGYSPKPGDVVIDVGAGIGTEIVVFAKAVGSQGRVIAIEAHPATCEALRRTVTRSGLTNVEVLHLAVADREGELLISDLGGHHIGNSITGVTEGVPVRSTTLDRLADDLGIDRVDYLKMNIEGAEALAIRGMERLVARIHHIAIACHDFIADEGGAEGNRTLVAVRAFLARSGFTLSERSDDPRPWVRDQIYGFRPEV